MNHTMSKKNGLKLGRIAVYVGVWLLCAAGSAHAATLVLNVDLEPSWAGVYSGPGVLGTGNKEDLYNAGTLSNLTYDDGSTLSPFSINGITGATADAGSSIGVLNRGDSVNSQWNGTGVLTISGATPGQEYNLVLFGYNNGAYTTYFTLGGGVQTTDSTQGSAFAAGVNYVKYSSITSDIGGNIQVLFDYVPVYRGSGTGNPGPTVILNGFQLSTVVPEPSTFLLVGLGGACLSRWRKRRA